MSSLRPLLWVLVVALVAPFIDRGIARLYLTYTANSWAQIGDEMREILDARPALDLLVIGDSSARHAADLHVLDAALGTDGYNFGAYRPAITGQIANVRDELQAGRRVKAIVLVTTEHGAMAGFGAQERAVSQSYYRSLTHVRWWWGQGALSLGELCDWLFALVSPSFGAGKPLETFAADVVTHARAGTLEQEMNRRRGITEKRRADDVLERGHYHLGTTPNRAAIARGQMLWRGAMGFEQGRARWRMHQDVARALEWLLEDTDRRGVPVFLAFTPRHQALVGDARYDELVRAPIAAWAEPLKARHPSFHLVDVSRELALGDDDFFDTADHLSRDASARFSAALARAMMREMVHTKSESDPSEMPTRPPATEFVRGAPLSPASGLRAWLDATAATSSVVRLPVVLGRAQVGFSLRGARVGAGPDALELMLDDSALGIGLADRARHACGDAPTCALWVEGVFRGERDGALSLQVLRAGDALTVDALSAILFAEVQHGQDGPRGETP